MRRCLVPAGVGAAVLALAGCAAAPHPAAAPAPGSAPAAASAGESFAALAGRLHSPRLMAMVLLREARAKHDADRALMASLFAAQGGDYALASEAADLAHQYDPKRPEPYAVKVKIALDQGDVAAARSAAQQAYALGGAEAVELAVSGSIDAWFSYAVVQPLAQAHPKDSELALLWAQTALSAGDSATALRAARASHAPGAQVIEVQAQWDLGHRKEALALAQKVLAESPHDVQLRVFVAGLMARANDFARARETLSDAAALAPGNEHVELGYALVDAEAGDRSAAQARLTKLLEGGSEAPGVYNLLGRLAANAGDWAEAFGWYQGITDGGFVDSAQTSAVLALGRWQGTATALDYLGHLRDAFPALDPTWASAQGELLANAGDTQEAYGVVAAAAQKYPMVRPLRYQRALLGDELGKTASALATLHRLVGEEPQNADYLNAYGYMLLERTDRYREGYRYIARALAVAPDDGAILDSMGWALFRLGEPHKALPYLTRAWSQTGDSEVAGHLVQVYLALGDSKQAGKVLAAALAKSPTDATLLKLQRQLAAGKSD